MVVIGNAACSGWLKASLIEFLVLVAIALGVSPVAANHITCGDTLGPGGTYVLDSDLVCDSSVTPIALTVDSAILNLGSHTITCVNPLDNTAGLTIIGVGSTVTNGTVTGCDSGIVLGELGAQGNYRVTNVTAKENRSGFVVLSLGNQIVASIAEANGGDGFFLWHGHGVLIGNTALDNGGNGFVVGGTEAEFSANTAKRNGEWGFRLIRGLLSVTANTAAENGLGGFQIGRPGMGANSTLRANTAVDNGGPGFEVNCGGNKLAANTTMNNALAGIHLTVRGGFNVVTSNTATGNGTVDLRDDNASCDNNTWEHNTFTTDEVAGITDGGPRIGCIQ